MMWSPVVSISFGAAAGALLRWQLGVRMNSLLTLLPLGTLTANLIGGYIIGVAVAYLAEAPNLAPEWRLFIITASAAASPPSPPFLRKSLRASNRAS